jgi:hypothetical protein
VLRVRDESEMGNGGKRREKEAWGPKKPPRFFLAIRRGARRVGGGVRPGGRRATRAAATALRALRPLTMMAAAEAAAASSLSSAVAAVMTKLPAPFHKSP